MMSYSEAFGRVETMLAPIHFPNEDAFRGILDAVVDKAMSLGMTENDVRTLLAKAVQ